MLFSDKCLKGTLLKLRYKWHVTPYLFQMYNVMSWYLCVLWNDPRLFNNMHHHIAKISWDKNFLRYVLITFQINNIKLLTIITMLFIQISMEFIYNWKFVHFDPTSSFAHYPLPLATSSLFSVIIHRFKITSLLV